MNTDLQVPFNSEIQSVIDEYKMNVSDSLTFTDLSCQQVSKQSSNASESEFRLKYFVTLFRYESVFELTNELDTWRGQTQRLRDERDTANIRICSCYAWFLRGLRNLFRKYSKSLREQVS